MSRIHSFQGDDCLALKAQLKLAFNRKEFQLVFFILLFISAFAFCDNCASLYGGDISNVHSAYSKFIIWENGSRFTAFLPFVLCVLLAVPFSDSYLTDKKSGVLPCMLVRCGTGKYFYSKLAAVAAISAIVAFVPVMLNLLLNLTAFPVHGVCDPTNQMSAESQFYTVAAKRYFLSSLFYKNPYIYCVVFLALFSAFIVLASMLVYKLSYFITRSRVFVVFSFFIIYDIVIVIGNLVPIVTKNENTVRIDPFSYITPGDTYANKSGIVFAAIFIILIVANLVLNPFCIKKLNGDGK